MFSTWTPSSFLTQKSFSALYFFLPHTGQGFPLLSPVQTYSLASGSYVDLCAECISLGCSVHISTPAFPTLNSAHSHQKWFLLFYAQLNCWYYHLPRYPSFFIFIPNHWDLKILSPKEFLTLSSTLNTATTNFPESRFHYLSLGVWQ